MKTTYTCNFERRNNINSYNQHKETMRKSTIEPITMASLIPCKKSSLNTNIQHILVQKTEYDKL